MNTGMPLDLAEKQETKIRDKIERTGNYWVKIKRVGDKNKYYKIVPRAKAIRMIMGIPYGHYTGSLQKLSREYEVVE